MTGPTGNVVLEKRAGRRWVGLVGRGRGIRSWGLGLGSGARRLVVEKIEAATEAEWVILGLVESLALRLGPELFWILRHCRSW